MQHFKNVKFYQLEWLDIQKLATFAERKMDWSMSISGGGVYVTTETGSCEIAIRELT